MIQHPELFILFSEKWIHENKLESQIWRKHCKGKNFIIKNTNAGIGEVFSWVPNVISGLLGFLIGWKFSHILTHSGVYSKPVSVVIGQSY